MPLRTRIALVLALVLSAALIPAAYLLPAYEESSIDEAGRGSVTTQSLVGANGSWVLILVGIPLMLTLVVTVALARRRPAVRVAWIATAGLGVLCLLGSMTIGVLMLPAVLTLVIACATAQRAVRASSQAGPVVARV